MEMGFSNEYLIKHHLLTYKNKEIQHLNLNMKWKESFPVVTVVLLSIGGIRLRCHVPVVLGINKPQNRKGLCPV